MTRTRMTALLPGLIAGGFLVGLTACGSTNATTVSTIAPETSVVAANPVSTSPAPAPTAAATSTTSATTVAAPAPSVAANSAKSSTTTTAATAAKTDLSAVLALVDSAETSAAAVDKELNTANNAMNSTEQDPQP